MTTSPLTPSVVALAAETRAVLGKFIRRVREDTASDGLTWSQLSVLAVLERDGPASIADLARQAGVRPQSMGATVAALESDGLLVGTPDPADRRRTLFSLTEPARLQVLQSRRAREDWLARRLVEHLTEAERETVRAAVTLLDRLASR